MQMPDGSWKREGQYEMMVSLDSARLWYPREERVACNADHSQIAKLKRGESGIYPSVRWAIKQALLSAADLYNGGKQQNKHGIVDDASRNASKNEIVPHSGISQNPHRESSVSLDTRPVGLVAGQARSQSEDAMDQHAKKLSALDIDQNDRRDIAFQSMPIPIGQTVSQWQRDIEDCVDDDFNSQLSPSISTEMGMTFSISDMHKAKNPNFQSTTSLCTEVCIIFL